ncbi:MAG: nucleotide exchange factor GrpE [Patescibacteria group bacterium]
MKPSPEPTKGAPSAEDTAAKLAAAERARDEYLEGWKRANADLANYKKEEQERFATLAKFANEGLVADLLSVLDSFDLGTAALDEANPAKHGFRMIQAQFLDILKRQGLEPVRVLRGEQFDPTKHEAVGEADADRPPGTIIEEVSRGYTLNGKIIRAARVLIVKEKGQEPQEK